MVTAVLQKLAAGTPQLRSLKRLARSDSGATAVELGLVAAPFLALLIGLFQTALVFLAGRELDAAVAQAARTIMTGQAQTLNLTQSQFNNTVCQNIYALFSCSKLMVNVKTYGSFATVNTGAPTLTYNGQGQVTNAWSYTPGGPGDIVVVQVMYQWPVVLAPLGFNLSNLANGNRLLVSTAVFKNEPY